MIGIVRKALLKKRGKEFAEDFKGKGWWARFVTRWPELALHRADALAVARRRKEDSTGRRKVEKES